MDPEKILAAAKAAKPKVQIEEYRDAVNVLRDKGYTWREIADFLNQQGVQTDHTRVYRTFGKAIKESHTSSREVEIQRITFTGTRQTKKKNKWNILDLVLPTQIGKAISLTGFTWGSDKADLDQSLGDQLEFRNAILTVKSGNRFPMAFIKLDLKVQGDWQAHEVYIMPKWETLL